MTTKDPERSTAADDVVATHLGWVFHRLRALGVDAHDAEDLAQDAFLALLAAVPQPERTPRRVGGFLGGTLLNLSRAWKRRRRPATLDVDAPAVTASDDALVEAVRGLPDELSEAVLVCYGAGFTYEEAADVLGVPRATIQSRLRRALKQLRDALGEGDAG